VRSVLILIFVNLLIIANLELASNIILSKWEKSPTSSLAKDGTVQMNYISKYFCDNMHSFENMHELVADHLIKLNFKKDDSLWFFGGSTTKSLNCKVKKNYPEYIAEKRPDIQVFNFAHSGKTSDDQIQLFEKMLKIEKAPNYVFWGNYINELTLPSQGFKLNRDILIKDYSDIIEETQANKNQMIYFLASLNKTLYETSSTYKLMFRILVDKTKFNYAMTEVEKTLRLFEAVIDNYKINLEKLIKYQQKYNFKIIIVQPPYRDDLYEAYAIIFQGKWRRVKEKYMQKYISDLNSLRREYLGDKIKFYNFREIFIDKVNLK
jgi:hypothetical protein